ncbi:MAG: hypothetical protein J0H09_18955 [Burkholderiales bacterium]|nr:hypothetical protein [Burkholderiales bacterium]
MTRPGVDEIPWGTEIDCGQFSLSEGDIVAFGERYDPQTLHTDPVAAKRSHFGRLIASGAHTMSAIHALVHRCAAGKHLSAGCAAVSEMKLFSPVSANSPVRVSHLCISSSSNRINCRTQAFSPDGNLLASITAQYPMAFAEPASAADREEIDTPSPPLPPHFEAPAEGLWFEDCVPGAQFGLGPIRIGPTEPQDFTRRFGGTPNPYRNEWFAFSLATKVLVQSMWKNGHAVAGATVTDLRFPRPTRAGDLFVGTVTVQSARPSRSKSDLGLVELLVSTTSGDGSMVCVYQISVIVKKR